MLFKYNNLGWVEFGKIYIPLKVMLIIYEENKKKVNIIFNALLSHKIRDIIKTINTKRLQHKEISTQRDFQHKEIHKLTWKSPVGRTVNQIDHVVINNKWRRSLKDVHTCRGADAGSDHYLVVSRLKLCLRKAPIKHDRQRRYNIAN